MPTIRLFVLAVAGFALIAALPAVAQRPPGDNAVPQGLTVVKCDAAADSCGNEKAQPRTYTMPVLGPAASATVLSPSQRSTEVSLDAAAFGVPVPGCVLLHPGVLMCESVNEYQHCRTLMKSAMVHSCQIDTAFSGGFAEPREATSGTYQIGIQSDARLRVPRDDRGYGQIKGKAKVELILDPPAELTGQAWCLQSISYLYYPTGPQGGMSEFGDSGDCEQSLEFNFTAHRDDLLRAFDLCEEFAAWGDQLEDSIDVLIAGLFQIRSGNPEFMVRYPEGAAIIARYVNVKAPLSIDCRI
jgi:hypothetical protein